MAITAAETTLVDPLVLIKTPVLRSAAVSPASVEAPHASFFFRRKSKDEKRLFFCERRLRNPHAPWFSGPKGFRVAVAQYLPGRAHRLVTGSLKVRELHSYVVNVGAMIFDMEIESVLTVLPILLAGALVSLCHRGQGITCR
jgi:hypothetical protein